MSEDVLVTYSLRLRPDQIATIKQLEVNFSSWAREKFDEDFMNPEEIDKSIDNLQKQIDNLKQRKVMVCKQNEERQKIPKNELGFLLETKELLEKRPEFTDGRISSYMNLFGKPFKISRTDFFEILRRAAQIEAELNPPKIEPIIINNDERRGKENG